MSAKGFMAAAVGRWCLAVSKALSLTRFNSQRFRKLSSWQRSILADKNGRFLSAEINNKKNYAQMGQIFIKLFARSKSFFMSSQVFFIYFLRLFEIPAKRPNLGIKTMWSKSLWNSRKANITDAPVWRVPHVRPTSSTKFDRHHWQKMSLALCRWIVDILIPEGFLWESLNLWKDAQIVC